MSQKTSFVNCSGHNYSCCFGGGGNSSLFGSQATFKEKQVIMLQFVVHSLPSGRRCPQKLKFCTKMYFYAIVNLRIFGNMKILFFLQKHNRKYLIEILIGINLRRDFFWLQHDARGRSLTVNFNKSFHSSYESTLYFLSQNCQYKQPLVFFVIQVIYETKK